MNELFGELRSWMQDPRKRFEESDAFYALLSTAQAAAPDAFMEQWTGYLEGYSLPPLELWGLEELRAARPYLPSNAPLSYHFPHIRSAQEFDELLDLLEGIWLHRVTLPNLEDEQLARLAAREHFACVESLIFDFNIISAAGMARLLDGDAIAELKSLELRGVELDEAMATRLASAPGLATLERLVVRSTRAGHGLVKKMAASNQLTSLRRVEMELHHADGETLSGIANTPWFAQLEHLNLSKNNLYDDALVAIAHAPAERLHTLRLGHHYSGRSHISEQALAALFDSPHRAQLATLDLSGHRSGNEAFHLVSRAAQMRALEALDLSRNRLTGGGIQPQMLRENLPALTSLRLRWNELGDSGCDILHGLPRLRELDLTRNRISAKGIASLVASDAASVVEKLRLVDNELDEESADVLASTSALSSLATLDVSHNALEDKGIAKLSRADWFADLEVLQATTSALTNASAGALRMVDFSQLRVLDLSGNGIDDDGAAALLDAPWFTHLTHLGIAPIVREHIAQLSDEIRERLATVAEERGITRLITRYNRSILYPWRDALTP